MRLLLAKALISCYLCFMAYQLTLSKYASESLRKVLVMNVEALQLDPRNT